MARKRRAWASTKCKPAPLSTWWSQGHEELVSITASRLNDAGFCIGGRFALLLCAKDRRIKACAAAYPSIESPRLANQELDAVALSAQIECPVHILQPGKDHVSSPETYTTLNATLLKRGAPTTVQYYPVAEHGFMHRKEPDVNPKATALAGPQMLAFLKACLS